MLLHLGRSALGPLLLAAVVSRSVAAHDFWIQPNEYWTQPQALTPLTLQVGHGAFRQRSPISKSRVKRFEAFAPDGTRIDLHDSLHLGASTEDGHLQFRAPGTYVVVLETDNRAQSHLPSIRFNDYLEAEGLTPALERRRRMHRMDADGSERYSRVAKSILQVGTSGTPPQAQLTRALGLPLEIVLDGNPYTTPNSILSARVIYEGRPIAGVLVKLTDLDHDAAPFEMHVTDRNGRATFALPSSGKWLLNAIWTKPLPESEEVDFETVFSSLSFGFR